MLLKQELYYGNFWVCPICKQAYAKSPKAMMPHLRHHIHKKEMPERCSWPIKMLLINRKGCNRILEERVDEEMLKYARDFVQKMKEQQMSGKDMYCGARHKASAIGRSLAGR